jgi:phospholipase A1
MSALAWPTQNDLSATSLMKTLLRFLLPLLAALQAVAGDLALALMAPAEPVAPGHAARIDLIAINPAAHAVPFAVEPELPGTLTVGPASWPVALRAVGVVPAAVPPGGFAVRRFTFEVPAEAAGRTTLEIKRADGTVLRALLDVTAARIETEKPAPTPLDRLASSAPASAALARSFAGRFQPNLPVYFLHGGGADQAVKYQLSFDYRLGTMVLGEAGQGTVTTLRLGYTQRSLWDTAGRSSPFYDTSYLPELVVTTEAPLPRDRNQAVTWLGLRAGFQHESNGKDGPESRSLNIVYFRPRLLIGSLHAWSLLLLPEVHAYLGDLSENKALKDYRGYGKLRFYIGRNDGPTLMFSGWTGKNFDHASYQLDLSIPTRVRWLEIESFVHAQYFNGYGESLRSYDRKSDALRVGLSLVR